jgi:hypothetical protein
LRQAVEELNAASGGTILFSSNVSTVVFTNDLSITNNLHIIGPGADQLSLACTNGLRSIWFSLRATCVVAGVTFSNVASGNAGALNLMSCRFRGGNGCGSAIDNSGALTMSNSALSECWAESGGAIYNKALLLINDCTFTGNIAWGQYDCPGTSSEGRGGAIYSASGAVTLKRSSFVGNWSAGGWGSRGCSGGCAAGRGGALYVGGGSLNADDCVFERNSARGGEGSGYAAGESSGGAVCITNAIVEFRNCVFTSNQVLGADGGTRDDAGTWVGGTPTLAAGGAVSLESGLLSLINASFSANCVTGGIGGGYIFPGAACFPAYGGPALGGAVYLARGTATLDHCTVTANWAVGRPGGYCMNPPSTGSAGDGIGGGIYNDRGSMWFNSVTFLANQKKSGDGAAMPSDYFENAPRMTGVQRAGNAILVSFTTQTGQTYGVQYLTSDPRTWWAPLPGVIDGTGGIATFTDSGASSLSNRYYRVFRNP